MPRSRSERAGSWLQRVGLALLAALVSAGCVVTAPQAQTGEAYQYVEPPARVGKIGFLAGDVVLTDTRSGEGEAAALNWPITSGHRLTTGRDSRAEVRVGSLAIRLDEHSIVDFNRVDDSMIQLVVQTGSVALRLRSHELAREIDVLTPRERVTLEQAGRYRLDVDLAPGTTSLTTLDGQARISGNDGRMVFTVLAGQRGDLRSAPTTAFQLAAPTADGFDDWVAARERRDDAVASIPYVSPETTGIETLQHYGAWHSVPSYGSVWFPHSVPVGWAPYRYGRWAYVAPWGWTWIDDAPWGFAPFHYGRWVHVGGVWGWYPGAYVARPVYAPALVGWYGAPGISVGVSVGYPVGWFPLGYGECYIPPWRYSRRYITAVNVPHVHNINNITVINPPPRYRYQAPGTATWAPNDAIVRQRPIQRVIREAPPEHVRVPTVTTPPVATPQGFNRKIVPVNAESDSLRTPALTSDRVAPPRVVAVPPAGGGGARAVPSPADRDPQFVRPQPRAIAPSTATTAPTGRDPMQGRPQPKAIAPPVAPAASPASPPIASPSPAINAPAPAPRSAEFVTRPRPPAAEAAAPAVRLPPPPRAQPAPVAPAPSMAAPSAPAARVAPPVRVAPPSPGEAPAVRAAPPPQVAPPAPGPKFNAPGADASPRGSKFLRQG